MACLAGARALSLSPSLPLPCPRMEEDRKCWGGQHWHNAPLNPPRRYPPRSVSQCQPIVMHTRGMLRRRTVFLRRAPSPVFCRSWSEGGSAISGSVFPAAGKVVGVVTKVPGCQNGVSPADQVHVLKPTPSRRDEFAPLTNVLVEECHDHASSPPHPEPAGESPTDSPGDSTLDEGSRGEVRWGGGTAQQTEPRMLSRSVRLSQMADSLRKGTPHSTAQSDSLIER